MNNNCLPCHLIARNIIALLALIAGGVILTAEIHATANQHTPEEQAMRRLFVYQIVKNLEQQ